MCTWDALNVNANRTKVFLRDNRNMFESRISARATEKLFGWEKHHAETVSWSFDVEGHAKKVRAKSMKWQLRRLSSCTKSLLHAWTTTTSRRKKLRRSENGPKYAHKLSQNACVQPERNVWVTNFCWSNRDFSRMGKFARENCGVVLRNRRTCSKRR